MDSQELLVKIEQAVSKSLTPEQVSNLKNDGRIQTIKIVSSAFDGKGIAARLEMALSCINQFDPQLLKKFDLTLVLVSKIEDKNWIDFEEANNNSRSNSKKYAAKEV